MKKFCSLILAVVVMFIVSVTNISTVAYAADADTSVKDEISVQSATYKSGTVINTSWKTIATSSPGFNCNVYIKCMNTTFLPNSWTVSPTDIRMLGKNGKVIWSESSAVPGQGNRTFWCGSDVYTILARCQTGTGTIYIRQAN